ncbi:MAG: aminotransferase class I/II-fold pyridoxal phosphate-dependent enzyme [Pirellulaceae bacterium]
MSEAHSTPLGQSSTPWQSGGPSEVAARVIDAFENAVRSASPKQGLMLSGDTPLFELGIDSLKQLEIVSRIQDEFNVRIPEDRLYDIETCGDVATAIEHQLQAKTSETTTAGRPAVEPTKIRDSFQDLPEYRRLRSRIDMLEAAGCENPFFAVHDAIKGSRTHLEGRELIDFGRFNYLGMAGDPTVNEAAKRAVDHYGTSVASSRLVSGTTALHREVEQTLADFLGVDDALVFSSGFVTNATIVAQLVGADDLILHDELIHHSIVTGSQLSSAERLSFPHNDWQALDEMLERRRNDFRRVLIAVEGVYSMDGDYPELPQFVEVKKRRRAMLMLDEAHSVGTMGGTGRGVCELQGVDPRELDVRVGTIGKALGGAGGFVCGSAALIEYLKYTCPGIIFSTALAPPCAAAALAAIRLLEKEPQRVATLGERAAYFLKLARQRGFNVGSSEGTPIIPVILGSSILALKASQGMLARGYNVPPILYPAVEEERARLRFFISARHSEQEIESAVEQLAEVLEELQDAS